MSLYSPRGFIFIHTRKTGGTSLRNMLLSPLTRYLIGPHSTAIETRDHMSSLGGWGMWNLAFKFAFVRNPYTWVESMRRHALVQEDHVLHSEAHWIKSWPDRLAKACRDHEATTDGTLCFQHEMVMEGGEPIVDRLCCFENYADEVRWILDHLGIEQPELLPHVGKHGIEPIEIEGQYRAAIADNFARDFELLKYEP